MKKLLTTACQFVVTVIAIVSFIAPTVFGQEKIARSPSRVMRFAIDPPAEQPLMLTADRDLAISPDGTHMVHIARAVGEPAQLMIRAFDQLDAVPLDGAVGARTPFFSPDGQWVGFFANGELKKLKITGGPPTTLCRISGVPRGASWGPDETIVFATDAAGTGLFRVPVGGGEAKALTTPATSPAPANAIFKDGEKSHQFPIFLPDGRSVLFTIRANGFTDTAELAVAVLDLTTGKSKILVRGGSQAEYVDTGHLIFGAAGTLRAVRFDLERLEVRGESHIVQQRVMTKRGGAANFSISRQGSLLYVPGDAGGQAFKSNALVWVNRHNGVEEIINAPINHYSEPKLSPDGSRVALGIRDAVRGQQDLGIGIWDLKGKTLTPLPFRDIAWQVWAPDGRSIIFASELGTGGAANMYRQAADGTGGIERLTTSNKSQAPLSISPDGRSLVFGERAEATSWDFSLLSLSGPSTQQAEAGSRIASLIQTKAHELNAEISPDGRWLAYQSNESGRHEVYVSPFPNVNTGRWSISTGGGTTPAWARNGRELFYLDSNGFLTVVPVKTAPTFKVGSPAKVLHKRYYSSDPFTGFLRSYDVSLDGQRFLMIKDTPASMVMVTNWFDELKLRVPAESDNFATARAAAEHFIQVFQNLDWKAFRATWVSEPTVFFPFNDTPERVTGRVAVEARWLRMFDEMRSLGSGPPYFQIRPQDLQVKLYGDAAVVSFNLGVPPGPAGRRTLLFVKENGQWKLAHLHASTATRP